MSPAQLNVETIGPAALEETSSGLRIVIRAKGTRRTLIWVPIFTGILVVLGAALLAESNADSFVLPAIIILVALSSAGEFLWSVGGREVITIDNSGLTESREIFHIPYRDKYPLAGISNLRYAAPYHYYLGRAGTIDEDRTIVFDYEFLPQRIGYYLSEQEAGLVIARIQKHLGNSRDESGGSTGGNGFAKVIQ